MNTNLITFDVDPAGQTQTYIHWLMSQSPEMTALIFALLVGYAFRRFSFIPNGWVYPMSIFCGLVLYAGGADWITNKNWWQNWTHRASTGFAMGLAGGTLALGLHNKVLGPLADRFPILKWLVQVDENTRLWKRSELPKEPNKPPETKL